MKEVKFHCRHAYRNGAMVETSFESSGPITALVGPSGCGKTTVLHTIAGLVKPRVGSVRVGDRVLYDSEAGIDLPPEERGVGLVFQDHRLFPHLSVKANLMFATDGSRDQGRLLDELVEMMELGDLLKRKPQTLSGGQCQRVAIGRAVMRRPGVLLMDEPFSSLDAALREQTIGYVKQLSERMRLHVVVVTHDMSDVRMMASRTIHLRGQGSGLGFTGEGAWGMERYGAGSRPMAG